MVELWVRILFVQTSDFAQERLFVQSQRSLDESLGRFEESVRLRVKASTCDDPVTLIEAQKGIAVLRGMEGDHRAALRDLERLTPLAHLIGKRGHPSYFAFLSSYGSRGKLRVRAIRGRENKRSGTGRKRLSGQRAH